MQNLKLKKKCFFSLLFSLFLQNACGQNISNEIALADSLFEQQLYTQSIHIYEQVYSRGQRSSPSMLLKMAYIEESTGNFTKALYYLSLYYMQRPHLQVVNKMKELAAAHNLQGYEFKDVDFFMILYQRYYPYFALVLLSICFIWMASLIARKVRSEHLPARHLAGCILFMIIVFLFLNIRKITPMAIVAKDNVYLMNAPSAGSQLISIIKKGHRLEIESNQDVWIEVIWNEKPAFVRQQNVLLIE